MPYTHFRLIAYEVHTASSKRFNPVRSGWDPGNECPAVARLPVPATVPDDARIRLKRLASVVDLATTQVSAGGRADDVNTLKVFLVPEFYLRPPASIGTDYKGSTYPVKVGTQVLDALNKMFVAADFADWLFVCGTLMWNTLADTKAEPLYFNTAIVVRGGRADALHVLEKRIPSDKDGIPAPTAPDKSEGEYAGPGYDPTVKLFFDQWSERKRHILVFDGISFGVEVCLDHFDNRLCRVLRRLLVDWGTNEAVIPAPAVQLHVLTAGGMDIMERCVCAKVDGYIMRNDGMMTASEPAASEMRQVQSYARSDGSGPVGPSDDDATAALGARVTPQYVPIPNGAQQVPPPGDPYLAIPQQRLAFYPVTPMP